MLPYWPQGSHMRTIALGEDLGWGGDGEVLFALPFVFFHCLSLNDGIVLFY